MDTKTEKIEIKVSEDREEESQVKTSKFKQFDTIDDDDDEEKTQKSIKEHHYFVNQYPMDSELKTRIRREWEILKQGLPDSIYVKVYKQRRFDLLKAIIVGPKGTPYHDGLFFFDIQFPCDYPNSPPKLHYCSFGYVLMDERILPLNKWWNTEESNVLQLLLAIHHNLVSYEPPVTLNVPKIYTLPVTNSAEEKLKHIASFHKTCIFAFNCKTMLLLLHKPPKYFEEFVAEHFCDRAETILVAGKAYERGWFEIDHHATTTIPAIARGTTTTTRYATWIGYFDFMGEEYPSLVRAFIKNGSPTTLWKFAPLAKWRYWIICLVMLFGLVVGLLISLVVKKLHLHVVPSTG